MTPFPRSRPPIIENDRSQTASFAIMMSSQIAAPGAPGTGFTSAGHRSNVDSGTDRRFAKQGGPLSPHLVSAHGLDRCRSRRGAYCHQPFRGPSSTRSKRDSGRIDLSAGRESRAHTAFPFSVARARCRIRHEEAKRPLSKRAGTRRSTRFLQDFTAYSFSFCLFRLAAASSFSMARSSASDRAPSAGGGRRLQGLDCRRRRPESSPGDSGRPHTRLGGRSWLPRPAARQRPFAPVIRPASASKQWIWCSPCRHSFARGRAAGIDCGL